MHKMIWWLIPLIFTAIAFGTAWAKSEKPQHGNRFPDIVTPMINIGKYALAVIASLICWLVYFIIF